MPEAKASTKQPEGQPQKKRSKSAQKQTKDDGSTQATDG